MHAPVDVARETQCVRHVKAALGKSQTGNQARAGGESPISGIRDGRVVQLSRLTFSPKGRSNQVEPLSFGPEGFRLRTDARATALEHFRRWYSLAGAGWVYGRVHAIAPKIGGAPTELEVRELGFRWGSCTRVGKVFINWKLLQLPVHLADYVEHMSWLTLLNATTDRRFGL